MINKIIICSLAFVIFSLVFVGNVSAQFTGVPGAGQLTPEYNRCVYDVKKVQRNVCIGTSCVPKDCTENSVVCRRQTVTDGDFSDRCKTANECKQPTQLCRNLCNSNADCQPTGSQPDLSCTPGDYRCRSNSLETCTQSRNWAVVKQCNPSTEYCDSQVRACVPFGYAPKQPQALSQPSQAPLKGTQSSSIQTQPVSQPQLTPTNNCPTPRRCALDGRTIESCNNGVWTSTGFICNVCDTNTVSCSTGNFQQTFICNNPLAGELGAVQYCSSFDQNLRPIYGDDYLVYCVKGAIPQMSNCNYGCDSSTIPPSCRPPPQERNIKVAVQAPDNAQGQTCPCRDKTTCCDGNNLITCTGTSYSTQPCGLNTCIEVSGKEIWAVSTSYKKFPTEEDEWATANEPKASADGYSFTGGRYIASIYRERQPNTVPLYSCEHPNYKGIPDRFLSNDPNCEGYRTIGIEGYSFETKEAAQNIANEIGGAPYNVYGLYSCGFPIGFNTDFRVPYQNSCPSNSQIEKSLGYFIWYHHTLSRDSEAMCGSEPSCTDYWDSPEITQCEDWRGKSTEKYIGTCSDGKDRIADTTCDICPDGSFVKDVLQCQISESNNYVYFSAHPKIYEEKGIADYSDPEYYPWLYQERELTSIVSGNSGDSNGILLKSKIQKEETQIISFATWLFSSISGFLSGSKSTRSSIETIQTDFAVPPVITEYDDRLCNVLVDVGDAEKQVNAKFIIKKYDNMDLENPEIETEQNVLCNHLNYAMDYTDSVGDYKVVESGNSRQCSLELPPAGERAKVFTCEIEISSGEEKTFVKSSPLKIANYVFPTVGVKVVKVRTGSSYLDVLHKVNEEKLEEEGSSKENIYDFVKDPEFYNFEFHVDAISSQYNALYKVSNLAEDVPKKLGGEIQNLPLEQLALPVYYTDLFIVDRMDLFPVELVVDKHKTVAIHQYLNTRIGTRLEKDNSKDKVVYFSPQIIKLIKFITGNNVAGEAYRPLNQFILTGSFFSGKYLEPIDLDHILTHELGHLFSNMCDLYNFETFSSQKIGGCEGVFPQKCKDGDINHGNYYSCFGDIIGKINEEPYNDKVYDVMGGIRSGMNFGINQESASEPLIKDGFSAGTETNTERFVPIIRLSFNKDGIYAGPTFKNKKANPDLEGDGDYKYVEKGEDIDCSVVINFDYFTIYDVYNPDEVKPTVTASIYRQSPTIADGSKRFVTSNEMECIKSKSFGKTSYLCRTELRSDGLEVGDSSYCQVEAIGPGAYDEQIVIKGTSNYVKII